MLRSVFRWLAPAVASACAVLSAQAASAGGFQTAPDPAWTTALAIPAPREARLRQAADGLYYLVVDQQMRPTPAGDEDYYRHVYKVIDRSGLNDGAHLDLDFDPAMETLVLHHVRVIRDGKTLDGLKDARVRVVQSESELDQGIITGSKTAHIEFADVRVGDIVDYAYSWITRDPQAGGRVYAEESLGWSTPVGVTRLRLVWPHGTTPVVRRYAGAGAPSVVHDGALDIYEWRVADAEPIPDEDDRPDWVEGWPIVKVSNMASWRDVAAWSAPHYAGFGPPAAWKAEIAAIAARWPRPEDRITEAMRLVQDRIRYVSLSIGTGAYRPRSPDAVVASGYGDCKDKSLLLAVVLRALGVDATPALTDIDQGPGLPNQPPSLSAFDHVIVRVRLGGRSDWIDATDSHVGGRFPDIAGLDYGWALPILPDQAALERIARPQAKGITSDVREEIRLARGPKPAAALTVVTTLAGADADDMRNTLASRSMAETEQKFLHFYGGLYPGIHATAPVAVSDDRDRDILVLREAYEIPAAALARGLLTKFPVRADSLEVYNTPAAEARRAALWLPYPVSRRHHIRLVTPDARPPAPPKAEIKGDGFRFQASVTRQGHTLDLDYTLTGLADVLAADKVDAHRANVVDLNDADYWNLDLSSHAGGTIGEAADWLVDTILVLFVAALAGAGVATIVLGGRAGDALSAEGRFYPVTPAKFVVMSLATFGLYDLFWMWKCWRWARRQGEPILPLWRAFFAPVWLYALFARANAEAGDRALPSWVGGLAAFGYLAWTVGMKYVSRLPHMPPSASVAGFALAPLFWLPAVLAVRRANAASPHVLAANSRFSGLSWAAMAGGLLGWALILLGLMSGK